MKFIVTDEVFEKLDVCFGVVAAYGLDNTKPSAIITSMLADACKALEERFEGAQVKEAPELIPYREAFMQLGISPNKFPSSIEAMAARIAKKKGFPTINPVVDLGNAVSLTYLLPLGAHDVEQANQTDIFVRAASCKDSFVPFGQTEAETPDDGEIIYAVGNQVKTRRWIWRQSELGKITAASKNVFFPIDGFRGINRESVLLARDELASRLTEIFNCSVRCGYVDREQPEFIIF